MDAPDPDKATHLAQIVNYLGSTLALVLAWFAKDTMARVKALEENRLTKSEFRDETAKAAAELSKARHDLRNDLQKIVNAIEVDRLNLRADLKSIFDHQLAMAENIATIKGKIK